MNNIEELTKEIGRIQSLMNVSAQGWTPALSVEQRGKVIDVLEAAMNTRQMTAAGPLAKALNGLPEPHERAALDIARSLAKIDGPNAVSPFRDDRLTKAYTSEQRYDAYWKARESGSASSMSNDVLSKAKALPPMYPASSVVKPKNAMSTTVKPKRGMSR